VTSNLKNILLPLSHYEIFAALPNTEIDIKGWIANQGYIFDNDILTTAGTFEFRASDQSTLKMALSNDYNRFSLASIESISGIGKDLSLEKSGAWPTIRAYYSSFYAAHAILRNFGISYSQLETSHVKKIFEMADLYSKTGGHTKIEKGFYQISICKSFSQVKFEKLNDSHADLWYCFLKLIDNLIILTPSTTSSGVQKIETVNFLQDIKKGITEKSNTRGNWLSVVRNDVNYKQSHNVWYPYNRSSRYTNLLDNYYNCWLRGDTTLDVSQNPSEIENFFQTSFKINVLLRELLLGTLERIQVKNTIISNGSARLLHTLRT